MTQKKIGGFENLMYNNLPETVKENSREAVMSGLNLPSKENEVNEKTENNEKVQTRKKSNHEKEKGISFSMPISLYKFLNIYIMNKEKTFKEFMQNEIIDDILNTGYVFDISVEKKIKELFANEPKRTKGVMVDKESMWQFKRKALLQYDVTVQSLIINKICKKIEF